MRKIILVLIFTLFFSTSQAFAQEIVEESPSPSPSPAPIQYVLPYPGLLPGHPLYSIKALRDKIIEFLITDPLKKADFYILQADKRLNSGILLSQQGKWQEAESTISKGENYLEMAVGRVRAAKEASLSIDETVVRLNLSTLKHQEVLEMLVKDAQGDIKKGLQNDLKRAERIEKEVQSLKSKN